MKNELEKKAKELEQTLQVQFEMVKKESEDFVKVGAVILASAVVAVVVFKMLNGKKKTKTNRVMEVLEKEGLLDDEIKDKLSRKTQSGFLSRMSSVLLPIAVNYGKEQFLNRINEPKIKPEENAK